MPHPTPLPPGDPTAGGRVPAGGADGWHPVGRSDLPRYRARRHRGRHQRAARRLGAGRRRQGPVRGRGRRRPSGCRPSARPGSWTQAWTASRAYLVSEYIPGRSLLELVSAEGVRRGHDLERGRDRHGDRPCLGAPGGPGARQLRARVRRSWPPTARRGSSNSALRRPTAPLRRPRTCSPGARPSCSPRRAGRRRPGRSRCPARLPARDQSSSASSPEPTAARPAARAVVTDLLGCTPKVRGRRCWPRATRSAVHRRGADARHGPPAG